MKILKWFVALLILVVIVAGAIAWTLPADVAYRYVASKLGPVSLVGVRGTVWQGHADGVSVFGRDLGELDGKSRRPLFARPCCRPAHTRADIDTSECWRAADGRLTAHDVRFACGIVLARCRFAFPETAGNSRTFQVSFHMAWSAMPWQALWTSRRHRHAESALGQPCEFASKPISALAAPWR